MLGYFVTSVVTESRWNDTNERGISFQAVVYHQAASIETAGSTARHNDKSQISRGKKLYGFLFLVVELNVTFEVGMIYNSYISYIVHIH